MKDKRKECGCHEGCTGWDMCLNPCRWPDCMTEEEHAELLRQLEEYM